MFLKSQPSGTVTHAEMQQTPSGEVRWVGLGFFAGWSPGQPGELQLLFLPFHTLFFIPANSSPFSSPTQHSGATIFKEGRKAKVFPEHLGAD